MSSILKQIVTANRHGQIAAIPSVCSAHPDVLRASLLRAQTRDRAIVIEATSNQVNQFGGYTGMTPRDFVSTVNSIADAAKVDRDRIIFGGDHLGPQVWRKGEAAQAMAKASTMVSDYVNAGFTKIHLDCSEGCAGEDAQVGDSLAASRAASLAETCLSGGQTDLTFVIGTEVPPPGGARADEEGDIAPTSPAAAEKTLQAHRDAFSDAAWSKVSGLVVQPGVEFAPMHVHHFPTDRDPALRDVMLRWPDLCLEAHSTDYQHPEVFPKLANLGFAYQKVGPALTFAYRQAVYALDQMQAAAGWGQAVVYDTMETLMLADADAWRGHYHGAPDQLKIARHFGLADRIRYYWAQPTAQSAVANLLSIFRGRTLPLPLLWQFFDNAVIARADAIGGITAQTLIAAQIQIALDPYFFESNAQGAVP